jgi:hypothetical protein
VHYLEHVTVRNEPVDFFNSEVTNMFNLAGKYRETTDGLYTGTA